MIIIAARFKNDETTLSAILTRKSEQRLRWIGIEAQCGNNHDEGLTEEARAIWQFAFAE
ncbi:hypothetical protein [Vibrio renipiscarius]|uniref:hypothetical protein n=1 Tax=Vibrio renipiscarius TaxID=1461322 RepID=UPI00136410C2|nr:hypothetical protein [Vibrio renipiscarius]